MNQGPIAQLLQFLKRKIGLDALELLETDNVRASDFKPGPQLGKPRDDVVDVVGGYPHRSL
jgi:hypothetical protein